MKKIILLSMIVGTFCLVAQPVMSRTYREPNYPYDWEYKAGNCIMVDQESEADATHVYTLNPDNTYLLNFEYYRRWGRNARCDELQFHVDHNTTRSRLVEWLNEVEASRYQNMAASRYEGNTVSTNRHEWYFIKDGVAHRIYDWVTGLSWGLLVDHRKSIPYANMGAFYDNVSFGDPLNYTEGNFYEEINAIWKDGERDFSNLPTLMAEEIEYWINEGLYSPGNYHSIFEHCSFIWRCPGDSYGHLLDWGWMARNPGCPLAD